MTGGRHDEHRAVTRQVVRASKRADARAAEVEKRRRDPIGPARGQIATERPADASGALPLGSREEHLGVTKRSETPDVVGMEMREHDPADVSGMDSRTGELGRGLVSGVELEASEPEERVPPGKPTVLRRR